jgi:ssDNA-binding Zn-finger/Zn-ribbon topoisomerase 1
MYIWTLRKYYSNGFDDIQISNDPNYQMVCPRCGKPLTLISGMYGEFYGCTGYKDGCKFTLQRRLVENFRREAKLKVLSFPQKYPHPEKLRGHTLYAGKTNKDIEIVLDTLYCK